MKDSLSIRVWLAALMIFCANVAMAQPRAKSKPQVAVLNFQYKGDNQWWSHGGAEATRLRVFEETLAWKSGPLKVVEREQLDALMKRNNLTLSGDVDPSTAISAGKLLGVKYLFTGTVIWLDVKTSDDKLKRTYSVSIGASLIDTSTGAIVWADEASAEESSVVAVGGVGGGVDDDRMFKNVTKPAIQKLTASLKAAHM